MITGTLGLEEKQKHDKKNKKWKSTRNREAVMLPVQTNGAWSAPLG